jgi:phosphatidate cytidylyltransferase
MVTGGGGGRLFVVLAITAALTVAAGWLAGPAVGLAVVAGALALVLLAAPRLGVGHRWAGAGTLYVGLPLVALTMLRGSAEHGAAAVLWLFAVVWLADIAAFAAGRTIGGVRLAPSISPAKTWSGALAALAAAAACGWLAAPLVGGTAPALLAGFSLAVAAVAIGGDLAESALKRRFGLKDAGTAIPGHGGAMDRVDSMIAASVAVGAVGALRGGLESSAGGAILW